jgi:uncharacterized protein YbjT (DUF2867 family)
MILVTGGTGFIGRVLVRNLVEMGWPVRTLIRPSQKSPNLPKGVPVEAAVSGLNDEKGLRAALVGVDSVYHIAGVERQGAYADLMRVDIQGTRTLTRVAADAGVNRIFYLSHLGADRASAFPVLKAKAIAEEFVRRSGMDYTIFRSAIAYGPGDGFTIALAQILSVFPYFFLIPGDGNTLVQPIWVEDLVAALTWSLDDEGTRNETYDVGGPEYLKFTQVVELVMETIGVQRRMVFLRPPYLRAITVFLESLFPGLPVSVYWLDYLATNRTCALDSLPRIFKIMPARLSYRLDYLRDKDWRTSLRKNLLRG